MVLCLTAQDEEEGAEDGPAVTATPLASSPALPLMVAQRPVSAVDAVAFSDEPRMLTTAARPFRIIHVNAAWTNAFGWELHEVG